MLIILVSSLGQTNKHKNAYITYHNSYNNMNMKRYNNKEKSKYSWILLVCRDYTCFISKTI